MFQDLDILLYLPSNSEEVAAAVRHVLEASSTNWEPFSDIEVLSAKLEDRTYDVLVLDFSQTSRQQLPEAASLRAWERILPVLLLLPEGEEAQGNAALQKGVSDYLTLRQLSPAFFQKTISQLIKSRLAESRRMHLQLPVGLAFWSYDFKEKQARLDEGLLDILGLKALPEPLNLEDLLDLVLKADRSILEQFISGLRPNRVQSVHLRRRHPNLGIRHLELHCCLYDHLGVDALYVSGSLRDITKQQRVEQELFKSQERYQIVFTQSKDPIFLTTVNGTFVDFNRATCDLLGYNSQELHQLHTVDLYWEEGGRPILLAVLAKEGFVRDYPLALRHKDGHRLSVRLTATTVEGRDFKGIQGILRDVTQEQKNAELQREKELVEERMRLKEQFLAGISHEIRTPMNAILGMTGLLNKTKLTEEQAGYTESIQQAADSLLQIINNILDAAQMQSGELRLQQRPVAIGKLLSSVQNIVKFKAREKRLKLVLEVEENLKKKVVLIDESRLAQVLINLLSNAIKFTDEGQVALYAKIDKESEQDRLRFDIQDTGDGISEENQRRIFEKFVQVSENIDKRRGGTGLGLAIVKQLVALMRGYLELQSELGVGTTFSLYIPLEYPEQKEQESTEEAEDTKTKRAAFCLLVAEDNDLNQVVAQRNIESAFAEAQVIRARNGKEVLEKLKKYPVDLILMDLEMPILDGYEATARIRAMDSDKANIPILALTAHRFLTVEKLREKGFDDWIPKPFRPDTLLNKIEAYRPSS